MGLTWANFSTRNLLGDLELTDAREQCMQRVIEKAAARDVKKSARRERSRKREEEK